MNRNSTFITVLVISLAFFQSAMARRGQYDEEARQAERIAKQQKKEGSYSESKVGRFAGGVKQAAIDGPAGFISDTVDSTQEEAPIVGTLEGARKGTEKLLDSTVKGAVKVATLGYGEVEHYEVVEPEKGTDDTTKIRFKIPGS